MNNETNDVVESFSRIFSNWLLEEVNSLRVPDWQKRAIVRAIVARLDARVSSSLEFRHN